MHWVLLRGLIRESRHWESFPALLQEAFPDACIHTVDMPGNGKLFKEKSLTCVSEMAAFASEEIKQKAIMEPVYLLSISLGGMIATEWMVRFPEQVVGAVIINSSLKGINPFFDRLQWRVYPAVFQQLFRGLSHIQKEQVILSITSNVYPDKNGLARKWAGYAESCPISRRNAVRQLLAAARYSVPLSNPTRPVLLLSSEQDRLVKADCSRKIAEKWQCSIKMHRKAGHDIPLDDAAWIIQQVEHWLSVI